MSPTWEETFEFPVKDFSRRLDVMVLDWDVVVAEKIGGFGIKLEDLVHKKRVSFSVCSTVSIISNRRRLWIGFMGRRFDGNASGVCRRV